MLIHIVSRGDSLYSIAREYGVTVADLRRDNQIAQDQTLSIGSAIVVPADVEPYTVRAGDSLYRYSRMYGTTVDRLRALNPALRNTDTLDIGMTVYVPAGTAPRREIDVNGYAYPTISDETLRLTLPNLTYLSPFAYRINADGTLDTIDDGRLIRAAYAQNTAPIMVVTNLGDSGGFDSELVGALLNDPSASAALIESIAEKLNEKSYYGVDVDFEYIPEGDREAYNSFLERLAARLRPIGYTISTAVAPKVSGDQQGRLYTAHDYAAHGRIADHVIIMTYEWGYTYGPPMAVAPVDQVERVIRYAVSVIPSAKILMGMPNYGYDWTLPYEQGTAARSLSNVAALRLAARYGAEIRYDARAQSPYFNYYDERGREHVVWFDDARSIRARLRLVDKYSLGGVSYWTVNSFFAQNWAVLNSMFDVRKAF